MASKSPEWRKFELDVAQLYRDLGAVNVQDDVNIAGNQVDVYAELPMPDGSFNRYAVSCKRYDTSAGIEDVKEWHNVVRTLKDSHRADTGVIVSQLGFSRPAKQLADEVGLKLFSFAQLQWANTDLTPYIDEITKAYEDVPVFKENLYIKTRLRIGTATYDGMATVAEFLKDPNKRLLLILGDYGAGKSTFCRKLFLEQVAALKTQTETRTPIFINVKDFPSAIDLPTLFIREVATLHAGRCSNYRTLQRLMDSGRILVILDAFDEMTTRADRATSLQNIQQIFKLCVANNKVILSCRTNLFQDSSDLAEHLTADAIEFSLVGRDDVIEAYTEPFNDQEIEDYIRRAFPATWTQTLQKIRATYDLMGLAQRPILLKMITEVLPTLKDHDEPLNTQWLYTRYVDIWLKRDDWRVKVPTKDRAAFTISFATAMYFAGKMSFTIDEIKDAIKRDPSHSSFGTLQDFENDIRLCSFIERKGDEFQFVHRSFSEYFVARKIFSDIARRIDTRLNGKRLPREVLSFVGQHSSTQELRKQVREWLSDKPTETMVANLLPIMIAWEGRIEGRLQGLVLSDDRLVNVRIESATLIDSEWRNLRLSDCNASDVIWKRIRWETVEWQGGEIQKAVVENCTFYSVELRAAALTARIRDSQLTKVVIEGIEEGGISMEGGGLSDCQINAPLLRVHLSGVAVMRGRFRKLDARIDQCEFEAAVFEDCALTDSTWDKPRFAKCSFSNCTFDLSRLVGATFDECAFDHCSIVNSESDAEKRVPISNPPRFMECTGLEPLMTDLLGHGCKVLRANDSAK